MVIEFPRTNARAETANDAFRRRNGVIGMFWAFVFELCIALAVSLIIFTVFCLGGC